jgi:hypothetical protein
MSVRGMYVELVLVAGPEEGDNLTLHKLLFYTRSNCSKPGQWLAVLSKFRSDLRVLDSPTRHVYRVPPEATAQGQIQSSFSFVLMVRLVAVESGRCLVTGP